MLMVLSESELEEQWLYEQLEAELGKSARELREEENLARAAAGRVQKRRKGYGW